MAYLENCDDSEKVTAFLKKLEQAIVQQTLNKVTNREKSKGKKLAFSNDRVFSLITIGLIFVVILIGSILALRLKGRVKRKKVKF